MMKSRQKQISNFLQREVGRRIFRKEEKLNQYPKRKGERSSGLLTSIDQNEVSDAFFCPSGAMGVRFTCGGMSIPKPGFTCKTKSQGTFRIVGKYGTMTTNKVIEVPLTSSNDWVEIFFQTTDPNGGYARWELIF